MGNGENGLLFLCIARQLLKVETYWKKIIQYIHPLIWRLVQKCCGNSNRKHNFRDFITYYLFSDNNIL